MTNNEYLEMYLDSCVSEIAEEMCIPTDDVPMGDVYADDDIADAVGAIWDRIREIVEQC